MSELSEAWGCPRIRVWVGVGVASSGSELTKIVQAVNATLSDTIVT